MNIPRAIVSVALATSIAIAVGCGSSSTQYVYLDGGPSCGTGSQLCGDSCTVVARDPLNCGACGTACKAGQLCSQGACADTCGGGTTKCGNACVDTKSDGANCGACGTKCDAGQVCSAGACVASCSATETKCGNACVDTKNDVTNCGACGTTCAAGTTCSNGACTRTCQAGLTVCTTSPDGGAPTVDAGDAGDAGLPADYCANLKTDNTNCGACGVACGAGFTCNGGACVPACGNGTTKCGNACVDTKVDPGNCGTCGNVCGSGFCSGSACLAHSFDSMPVATGTTSRGAGDSCGTRVTISTTVTIKYLAAFVNPSAAGNIKFMVWKAGVSQLISAPVATTAGAGWKLSNALNLTLTPGTYDIGTITDVATIWSYDQAIENVPPFVSTSQNPNWTNYATPVFSGIAGADCGVRIFL